MKKIFQKICIPLMLVDNNVYAFLSGILISLSTNIFTSLCFENFNIKTQWHLYISSLMLLISGAIKMFLAVKITKYQDYFISKQIRDTVEKRKIVIDITKSNYVKWTLAYIVLITSLILGLCLVSINHLLK